MYIEKSYILCGKNVFERRIRDRVKIQNEDYEDRYLGWKLEGYDQKSIN